MVLYESQGVTVVVGEHSGRGPELRHHSDHCEQIVSGRVDGELVQDRPSVEVDKLLILQILKITKNFYKIVQKNFKCKCKK